VDRRDLLFFFLGVGSTVLAGTGGVLFARWLRADKDSRTRDKR
jgi:hypothetical protein